MRILFLSFAMLLILLYAEQVQASSSFRVVPYDLGLLKPGTTHTKTFSLVNPFDSTFNIKSIKKSCNLTDAVPSLSSIEPQQRLDVKVTMKIGEDESGFFKRRSS